MKGKIIPAAILMAVFTVISLYISYNLHWLLMGRRELCSINPTAVLSGLSEPKIRLFFLLFFCVSLLFIAYMLVMQEYIKYKSDMQQITPKIATSAAEGQGPYGTARWLSKKN